MTVVALRPAPAYTPMGSPSGKCNTPGHEDRPARLYACGWRCDKCSPWGRKQEHQQQGRER